MIGIGNTPGQEQRVKIAWIGPAEWHLHWKSVAFFEMVPPLDLIFGWGNDTCLRTGAFERLLGLSKFYLFESLGNKNRNL